MAVVIPDWLSKREAKLDKGPDPQTWFVSFNHQIQYVLAAVPVAGKFGCTITQSINGKRVESPRTYEKADEAINGGLEELRQCLGW
jgi:hypothetical protein